MSENRYEPGQPTRRPLKLIGFPAKQILEGQRYSARLGERTLSACEEISLELYPEGYHENKGTLLNAIITQTFSKRISALTDADAASYNFDIVEPFQEHILALVGAAEADDVVTLFRFTIQ